MNLATIESYTKIFGVLVACFGVWKYFDSAHQETVNKSLSYFDEFHAGRVFDARIEIGRLSYKWVEARTEDGEKLNGEQLAAIILSDLHSDPGRIHYDVVVEFFARVYKCVKKRACHRETAIELLSDEANAMYIYFFPRILEDERNERSSPEGFLCFATRFSISGCNYSGDDSRSAQKIKHRKRMRNDNANGE